MIYNTGETSEELKAEYNPEGSILRKAQLRMLDMLLYIDKVCKEQGITYMLDGGNVLGAIRHQGFIPWDDDTDIILERKEYNRLCKYLLEHPHPQYVLQTPKTDPYFLSDWNVLRDTKSEYIQDSLIHNCRKYRGLQVDIFPLDNKVIKILNRSINIFKGHSYVKLLGHHNKLAKCIFNIYSHTILPSCRFVSFIFGNKDIYTYGYGLPWYQWRYPKDCLFPPTTAIFEGYEFPIPKDSDTFLKIHYGNYINLPNKSDRNHHSVKAYIIKD